MEYRIKIYNKGKIMEQNAAAGTQLLKFLRKQKIDVHTSCGGHGTCGKCKLRIAGLPEIESEKEKKLLGTKAIEKGYRLACYHRIKSDLEIYLDDTLEKAEIITEGRKKRVKLEPLITKIFMQYSPPSMEDQRSDLDRVCQDSPRHKLAISADLLGELPEKLRMEGFGATIGIMDKKIIFIEGGDTTPKNFGLAVDIGTTTIAAYLYDLNSGREMDVYSLLNPQGIYGADVLSRIQYTLQAQEALLEMNTTLLQCINGMIAAFCNRNKIDEKDIHTAVFVGNTTMMHFLMGIPTGGMGMAPFIPVTTQLHKLKAKELGLKMHPRGYAVILPSISAYVGADTISAVLSCGMQEQKKITLLLDIGTNGEMVLGNSQWMFACSTAAGPAFEGANIRNGIGGIYGAIDRVRFLPDFQFTTLGNETAVGLCGSGIIDAIAGMLSVGILDNSGKMSEDLDALPAEWQKRCITLDGMKAFLIEKEEKCKAGGDIVLTQKDVREIQNAKAAIAAGIKILVKEAGIGLQDIDRVFFAGGFGSCLEVESALKIGLIPEELRGKTEVIGNAAGAGAAAALVSRRMLEKTETIKAGIKYVELSNRADFSEEYIENMTFGDAD